MDFNLGLILGVCSCLVGQGIGALLVQAIDDYLRRKISKGIDMNMAIDIIRRQHNILRDDQLQLARIVKEKIDTPKKGK